MREKQVQAIYTFFGAGVPHPSRIRSIVSVAYPIICYPESPYWNHVPLRDRILKRFVNFARVRRLRAADRIVAETEVMSRRLATTLGINGSGIVVSPPAVTEFLSPREVRPPGTLDILCLSGLSQHKNLWRLPEIARELIQRLPSYASRIRFHISGTEDLWLRTLRPESRAVAKALASNFVWHGSVHPRDIGRLYAGADFLLSLSDLESFSNNYMEAWRARIPILASDRDFAREICKDSAVYAEPHNPVAVAEMIASVAIDTERQRAMVCAGDQLLGKLPSRSEKARDILDIIRAAL
jgi:glycosyltransferase involved in cell wall biosynthesis